MKLKNIILSLVVILAFGSCKDMFEPAMENNRTGNTMYEEPDYAAGLLMYGYSLLPFQTSTVTDIATDDAVTNEKTNGYMQMALGSWTSSNNPMSQWDNRKSAIQYLNLFLASVDKVKWAGAESTQQMFVDRQKGEALALRALQYLYLLQAHGGYADDGVLYGVPLLTAPEDASSDFNQPRATFADCIQQIFKDVAEAIELLPEEYRDLKLSENNLIPEKYRALGAEFGGYNRVFGQSSTGRMTSIIAEAIRAQAALLASSPAFEKSGITSEVAANYAAQVLRHVDGVNGIDAKGHIWYSSENKAMLDPSAEEMAEVLWRENRSNGNSLEAQYFPPTLYGSGRINPSQNLVDAFPAANGYPISDSRSGYDAKNPYANRDPRLGAYIITNESTFAKTKIVTGTYADEDGSTNNNINQLETSTRTGYYLKKFVREDCSPNPSSPVNQYHVLCRIRYTEMYLAYAEAANEAWGPTGSGSNGYSAYDVIKALRQRAGIGKDNGGNFSDPYLDECAGSVEKMRELIRNERRIELCFENKRFWDLRRWMLPLNEAVKGVQIDKNMATGELTYNPITVEERVFDASYQCYGPLPNAEVLKWSNLVQNKGWR